MMLTLKQAQMYCNESLADLREAINWGRLVATRAGASGGYRVTLAELQRFCAVYKKKFYPKGDA